MGTSFNAKHLANPGQLTRPMWIPDSLRKIWNVARLSFNDTCVIIDIDMYIYIYNVIFRKILGLQSLEKIKSQFCHMVLILVALFCVIQVCHFGFVLSFYCHVAVISLSCCRRFIVTLVSFLYHVVVICLSFCIINAYPIFSYGLIMIN